MLLRGFFRKARLLRKPQRDKWAFSLWLWLTGLTAIPAWEDRKKGAQSKSSGFDIQDSRAEEHRKKL